MTFPYRDIFVGQFRQGNFRAYYGWPSRVSRFVGTKFGRIAGIFVYGSVQEITESPLFMYAVLESELVRIWLKTIPACQISDRCSAG